MERQIGEGEYKAVEQEYPRFVSDKERAMRVSTDYIDPMETFAEKGNFNALDGTTHTTDEAADAVSERYLRGADCA